ncbi:hypothetical protein C8J57DRAFT_1243114 [Mycena rebaudengoi]|nr:hypothetical protein C8J57DRAFT_1243114 [Mycena rebaudengoi]
MMRREGAGYPSGRTPLSVACTPSLRGFAIMPLQFITFHLNWLLWTWCNSRMWVVQLIPSESSLNEPPPQNIDSNKKSVAQVESQQFRNYGESRCVELQAVFSWSRGSQQKNVEPPPPARLALCQQVSLKHKLDSDNAEAKSGSTRKS